jgi:diaminopimelate decarboxylase
MASVYESPVINKLQNGMMNKFGRSPAYARKVCDAIHGISIDELARQFGSPLFVYSEQRIRALYREAYGAFSRRYPNVMFAWSYKTNYLAAICAIMHSEGAIAEVVSEMEYVKARAMGIPGNQIIFNGPHKPVGVLAQAVREGAIINVDHLDEICDLEAIASSQGRRIQVGLRINLDAGIYPQWSRFGFNLESGQALDAIKRIANGGQLIPNGLHCHLGTFIVEPAAYARQIEKMIHFAYELEDQFGFTIDYLDIGGGLPSQNRLKATYLPPEVAVPSIEEFAERIGDALYRNLRPGNFPRLILESGRALIDEGGSLITTVEAAKRLADGTRAYVVDAGVNLLFTSFWYKMDIQFDREISGMNEHSVIYGPLCMNLDILDEGVLLPPLPRGTRLIFTPVGAYNNTQWMQFIAYRPNVILVGEQGEVDVIREAEDLSDVTRREKLPERLQSKQES